MSIDDSSFNIRVFNPPLSSLLNDDIEKQILSPLSCLREFGNAWVLEIDLPLVNKKDIKVMFDGNAVTVEAKLKETYSEEKFGVQTKFEFFKKTISLPGKIDSKRASAKFSRGMLTITIPKKVLGHKIKVE